MSTTEFATGAEEEAYIRQAAQAVGLDPEALLAIAAHEGVTLPSEIGDNLSSFGPWQLHVGGAYDQAVNAGAPSGSDPAAANAWANSPAGINYAVAGISSRVGSSNRQGAAEIVAQVLNFERPQDPQAEIAASEQTYNAGGGPGLTTPGAGQGFQPGTGTQQASGTYAPPGGEVTSSNWWLALGFPTEAAAEQAGWKPYTGSGYKAPGNPLSGVPIAGSIFGAGESTGVAVGGVVDSLSSWEMYVVRGAEIAAGMALVILSLVGVFIALSKSSPTLRQAASHIPVVG